MAVTSAAILLVVQTLRGIKLDGTKDTGKQPASHEAGEAEK
jgi:signal peptidase II